MFKNRSSLVNHQKNTKYCLKIQGVSIPQNFVCCFCGTTFTLKSSFQHHSNICKANTPYIQQKLSELHEKTYELGILKKQLEDALRREQELREDFNKLAAISAKKSTTTNNTTNNLNLGVFDKSSTDIKRIVDENYDRTYLIQGQKGVAKFTHKHVLANDPDKPPIYVITDRSRGNGKYKLSDTEIVTDTGLAGLTKKVHPSIKSKAVFITSTSTDPLEDEEMMAGYHEVFKMDQDNSEFRKHMSEIM
jgi:hypothetical protein